MKQILQNLRSGELSIADVPPPVAGRGRVLVRTAASLISAGTERMLIDLGKKSLLGKAKERPDLVKRVINKAKKEGFLNTYKAVRTKLETDIPLGYSAAGVVVDVGDDVMDFRVGDRVACAGGGFAVHAEVLSVPKNLCVRLPDTVSFEAGAFGTIGAVAMQGVRLAEPTLGESVVVIGLGLLGQLTVQLLRANGCRVFGIDVDASKIELAKQSGADDGALSDSDVEEKILAWTRGRGADAVLITAATQSNQPIEMAGKISRLKGRVVVVGLVGMDVPRDVYYTRELSLKVSMSYGPGRYDPQYEERGHDYPFAYVRWTEGRNVEAFVDLIADGRLRIEPLISHRFKIEDAEKAYDLISAKSSEPYLGVLLNYDTTRELESRITVNQTKPAKENVIRLGLIGAGSYAKNFLLPNFKANNVEFHGVTTAAGVSAKETAKQYGFSYCASSSEEILKDEKVNLIVIATRHDSHAKLARRALEEGKNIFVEKPLAMNDEELDAVLNAARTSNKSLMVGFNRRFSPLAKQAKELFSQRRDPLSILYRVNAGHIPREHWVQDPEIGGGRIIGEVCHFIDLMHFLTDAVTTRVYAEPITSRNHEITDEDSVFITLRFSDGSNATIAYLSEGDKALEKERIEIYGGEKTFIIDDFRYATAYKNGRETKTKLRNQDKGQAEEIRAVCSVILEGKPAPIALEDLTATTRATFGILESLRTGQTVRVN